MKINHLLITIISLQLIVNWLWIAILKVNTTPLVAFNGLIFLNYALFFTIKDKERLLASILLGMNYILLALAAVLLWHFTRSG